MNEILSIVVIAYLAERIETDIDFDSWSDEDISSSPENLTAFIFDSRHMFADIYSTFNQILSYGIKNLYQETKDISELRKELVSINYCNVLLQCGELPSNMSKQNLFEWKQKKEDEDKRIRAKLEKAYEQEKAKVNLNFYNDVVSNNEEV